MHKADTNIDVNNNIVYPYCINTLDRIELVVVESLFSIKSLKNCEFHNNFKRSELVIFVIMFVGTKHIILITVFSAISDTI